MRDVFTCCVGMYFVSIISKFIKVLLNQIADVDILKIGLVLAPIKKWEISDVIHLSKYSAFPDLKIGTELPFMGTCKYKNLYFSEE